MADYKSNYGINSSLTGKSCNAAFACRKSAFIEATTGFYCSGAHSCSNTLRLEISANVNCDGSMSCSGANITRLYPSDGTTLHVRTGGDKSASYAHIDSINNIDATGAYSLYKATIDSGTIQSIEVSARGYYAAYGAQFLCRLGATCEIFCDANACEGFYIRCLGECAIFYASATTVRPIVALTDTEFNEAHALSLIAYPVDAESITLSNDERCNMLGNTFVFDLKQERYYGADIYRQNNSSGPLCCRGHQSCQAIPIIEYDDIVVSGNAAAAYGSHIYSDNGTLSLSGRSSGKQDSIYNADTICAAGLESLFASVVVKANTIVCSGRASCKSATMVSSGSDLKVYLTAYAAGMGANIHCNDTDVCEIECLASRACDSMTVVCAGTCNIRCDEDTGCPDDYTITPTTAIPTAIPTTIPTGAPITPMPAVPPTTAIPTLPTGAPITPTHTVPPSTAIPVTVPPTTSVPTSMPSQTLMDITAAVIDTSSTVELRDSGSPLGDNIMNSELFLIGITISLIVLCILVLFALICTFKKYRVKKKRNEKNITTGDDENKKYIMNYINKTDIDAQPVPGAKHLSVEQNTNIEVCEHESDSDHKNDDLWDGSQRVSVVQTAGTKGDIIEVAMAFTHEGDRPKPKVEKQSEAIQTKQPNIAKQSATGDAIDAA